MLKRRKDKKTDYRARLTMLKSGKPRLVVRRSISYVHAQLVEYHENGDKTLMEETSKNLVKLGWTHHCGNVPAAYLTGLMIGAKAVKAGITGAVLDIGLQTSVKGCALYALAKGAIDAGMQLNVSDDILPSEDRVNGKLISSFKKSDIQTNFADVKKKIVGNV